LVGLQKYTNAEICSDFSGLSIMSQPLRFKAAIGALSVIGTAVDIYIEGRNIWEIKSSLEKIRKDKISQSAGYCDPNHIIVFLSDRFFI
jgi:hypothetical protein